MFVPVILGTGRRNSKSQLVANLLEKHISQKHDTEIISPKNYINNAFTERVGKEREIDEKGKKYQELINKADAIVVVIPEYNRSFPGELKLLLDLLYSEYKDKKFYLVGVSSGSTGGARAVESFIHAVVGVEGIPVKPKLLFSSVNEVFDEHGNLTAEKYVKRIEEFVDNF